MEHEPAQIDDPELQTKLILLAASHHDVESLRTLLRTGSASVQDTDTGFTPLHAAIAACEHLPVLSPGNSGSVKSSTSSLMNGHANGVTNGQKPEHGGSEIDAAAKTIRFLLQNGAIWNDLDKNDETPGCLALRLGVRELYEIMVDAGVRAEMLLSRLDEYEPLGDEGSSEEGSESGKVRSVLVKEDKGGSSTLENRTNGQSEAESTQSVGINNGNYLQSDLHFQDGKILDENSNGVMMAWESPIMQRTADLLAPKPGLQILNIGHGMGIIDTAFKEKSPAAHHIIEAHPAILARMKADGWYDKPNVTIHDGRWQDVVPRLMETGTLFDAIYFDTFAEEYKALRDFFSDFLLGLLDDGGRWGFFNGLGADRQICYDVYAKVVEMDLFEAGFDTAWEMIEVPRVEEGKEWEGVRRKYWTLEQYRLPICEFIGLREGVSRC
ncbi:Arginine N-methyltransferase 2 [Puttea exsequens]|nr:Arginine N-methyltransferase 2 [Puttea exsequens]